jgi:hypothetical protein
MIDDSTMKGLSRSSGEYYEIRGLESDGRASLREFFRGLKPQGLILHQKITFVTRGRGVNGVSRSILFVWVDQPGGLSFLIFPK